MTGMAVVAVSLVLLAIVVGCSPLEPRHAGRVFDVETGRGVPGASVFLMPYFADEISVGEGGSDTTDADGRFGISTRAGGKCEGVVLSPTHAPMYVFVQEGRPIDVPVARLAAHAAPGGAGTVGIRAWGVA